jgi:hypothetical protein
MRDLQSVVTVWKDLTAPDYYLLVLPCDEVKDVKDINQSDVHHTTICI